MYYAPHRLQKRVNAELESDGFGRPIVPDAGTDEWVDVCRCRCDHNRDTEIKKPDGTVVKPDYHIVCEGNRPGISTGDYVRCLEMDGSVRGEGYVINAHTLNYLPYAEIYC